MIDHKDTLLIMILGSVGYIANKLGNHLLEDNGYSLSAAQLSGFGAGIVQLSVVALILVTVANMVLFIRSIKP